MLASSEPEALEGAAAAVAPAQRHPSAPAQTVDFTKLDMATLKRYKRHYRLKTRQNVTKTELAMAVAKHFASTTVDEADTISLFMYSARGGSLQYGAPRQLPPLRVMVFVSQGERRSATMAPCLGCERKGPCGTHARALRHASRAAAAHTLPRGKQLTDELTDASPPTGGTQIGGTT